MADVVWVSYHEDKGIDHRGYYDHAFLEEMFKDYEHHLDFKGMERGGIVVVPARVHVMDTTQLNKDLSDMDWCLVILTGDEEGSFPWRELAHKRMKVWVMHPRIGMHDEAFKLPNGYRPTTRPLLKEMGFQERTQDWFFAGQINHARREECVTALREMTGGTLIETDGFAKEVMPYPEYIANLAKTKIAPCPSGIETPDSFRLYEALEAGCLPIVDSHATNTPERGYWTYLFSGEVPFPIVEDWSVLPQLIPELLKDYPHNANKAFAWWMQEKRKIRNRLQEDLYELQR